MTAGHKVKAGCITGDTDYTAGSMEAIEIQTGIKPDAAVIWLHGLGADGHDFEPIAPELRLPGTLQVRFLFPHAPSRPLALNHGTRMRAPYHTAQLRGGPDDAAG